VIIRSVEEILGTARDVSGQGWRSRRLILAEDGIDYSVHETTLEAGQGCNSGTAATGRRYCVSGSGTIEDVASGRVVTLEPGVL
jgi:L-ectoine synthase